MQLKNIPTPWHSGPTNFHDSKKKFSLKSFILQFFLFFSNANCKEVFKMLDFLSLSQNLLYRCGNTESIKSQCLPFLLCLESTETNWPCAEVVDLQA